MDYIINIKDGSSRYDFNVWTTYKENEESTEIFADTRIFASDNEQEFIDFLKELSAHSSSKESAKAFINKLYEDMNKDLPLSWI